MAVRITRDALISALSRHIGAGNGASARQLVQEITGELLIHKGAERQLRQLVEQLRAEEGHHICAHPSSGYYLAETPDELNDTCQFLYSRAMTSLRQVAAMKRVALPDLRGQLKLPD